MSTRVVAAGAFRFAAGAGVAKLFGILRDAYIARTFGLGEQVDAYLLAQTLALLPLGVIFLSLQPILTTAIARRGQTGPISLPRDLANTIVYGFVALSLVALVIWLALPRFLEAMAGHWSVALVDATKIAYGWIVAGAFFSAVSTLGYAVLHSRGRMVSSGLLPGLVPAVMIAVVLAMLPASGSGNLGFALFLGYVAEMIVVTLVVLRIGVVRVVAAETRDVGPRLSRQVYPLMLGMLMTGACPLIEQSFAVGLGAGAVSAFGFASRIPAALGGLAAMALSTAFLPIVAAQVGSGHFFAARRTFRLTAATMFISAAALAIVLWACSDLIVDLLFVGGKFQSEDAQRVSFLQGILGFGIPAAVLSAIAGRALIALSIRLMHLVVPLVSIGAIFALNSVLVPFLSVNGIALSNVIAAGLNAALLIGGAEIYLRRVAPVGAPVSQGKEGKSS